MRQATTLSVVSVALLGVIAVTIFSSPSNRATGQGPGRSSTDSQEAPADVASIQTPGTGDSPRRTGKDTGDSADDRTDASDPANESVIWAATNDARAHQNIEERQRLLGPHVAVLRGEAPPADGSDSLDHARSAAVLAAQILQDADSLTIYPPPGVVGPDQHIEWQESIGGVPWRHEDGMAHRMASGGAHYEILHGDFPVLDLLMGDEDLRMDTSGLETEEDQIRAALTLAEKAMTVRIP